MLRTYIYVPEEMDLEVKRLAKDKKVSKAEIIREAIKEGLGVVRRQKSRSAEVLLKIAEIGKKYKVKGPKDAVEHFDDYLYGKDWSKDE